MEFNAEEVVATNTEESTPTSSTVKADDPSLADLTHTELSILLKNYKELFLLLEGGRIDHAHHYNNPYRALDETLELETALLAALEKVNPAETIVVVKADHGHVMTFGGQATLRGHPILEEQSYMLLAYLRSIAYAPCLASGFVDVKGVCLAVLSPRKF